MSNRTTLNISQIPLCISIQTDLLVKTQRHVTKEKMNNRRTSVSTSASKPVNFEPRFRANK